MWRPLLDELLKFYGSIAQLVEQETLNLLVLGSNPSAPTKQQGNVV